MIILTFFLHLYRKLKLLSYRLIPYSTWRYRFWKLNLMIIKFAFFINSCYKFKLFNFYLKKYKFYTFMFFPASSCILSVAYWIFFSLILLFPKTLTFFSLKNVCMHSIILLETVFKTWYFRDNFKNLFIFSPYILWFPASFRLFLSS